MECLLRLAALGTITGCSQVVVIPTADCPYEHIDYSAVSNEQIRAKIAAALEECGLRVIGEQQMAMLDDAARARVLKCSFSSSSNTVLDQQVEIKHPVSTTGSNTAPTMQVNSKRRVTEVWADVVLSDSRGRTVYAARGKVDPAGYRDIGPSGLNVLLATDKALEALTAKCRQ